MYHGLLQRPAILGDKLNHGGRGWFSRFFGTLKHAEEGLFTVGSLEGT